MHAKNTLAPSLSLFAFFSLAAPLVAQLENAHLLLEPNFTITGQAGFPRGDLTGYAVAWVGDVNQDGFTDVVVGAPGAGLVFNDAGTVSMYSGRDGALLWRTSGKGSDNLGSRLAGAGDVNRDGIPDVIAGAPAADPGPGQ